MPVDLRIGAEPADDRPGKRVAAPGAKASPQLPGQVPDRSTIPGQFTTHLTKPAGVERPLSEYGTAQRIMGVYTPEEGHADDPARFEQATASYEELRKAYPAELPPQRPAPGYALATGNSGASERQEIGGPAPTPALPANHAPPGDASRSQATPERAPAASVAPSPSAGPEIGASSGVSPSASPGDLTSPGGTLPAAKEQQGGVTSGSEGQRNPGSPGEASQ